MLVTNMNCETIQNMPMFIVHVFVHILTLQKKNSVKFGRSCPTMNVSKLYRIAY